MLFQENNVRHFLLCHNEGDNNDFVTLQLVLKKKKSSWSSWQVKRYCDVMRTIFPFCSNGSHQRMDFNRPTTSPLPEMTSKNSAGCSFLLFLPCVWPPPAAFIPLFSIRPSVTFSCPLVYLCPPVTFVQGYVCQACGHTSPSVCVRQSACVRVYVWERELNQNLWFDLNR